MAVCLLLIQKSDFLRNAMHASNFLPNVFFQSTSKCPHIGGGDSQLKRFLAVQASSIGDLVSQ